MNSTNSIKSFKADVCQLITKVHTYPCHELKVGIPCESCPLFLRYALKESTYADKKDTA